MNTYSEKEKLEICLDISKQLKFYKNDQGVVVNLFNDNYTFVPKLKKIFSDYIKGKTEYTGIMEFEEIGKQIVYSFPVNKKKTATFVIKIKS